MTKVTQPTAENRKLAEEIYNLLMGAIEPDLLLSVIPTLDSKYKGEAPAEHEARMKRYQEAYKKFDTELAEFMSTVNSKARTARKSALKQKESQSREEESNAIGSLEAAFQ